MAAPVRVSARAKAHVHPARAAGPCSPEAVRRLLEAPALADASEHWVGPCSNMLRWRRECPLLGRTTFMGPDDITWWESDWDDDESRFLSFTLHDRCSPCAACHILFARHDCLLLTPVHHQPTLLQEYPVSLKRA